VQSNAVTGACDQLYEDVVTPLPDVLTGLVFRALAAVAIKLLTVVVRAEPRQGQTGRSCRPTGRSDSGIGCHSR